MFMLFKSFKILIFASNVNILYFFPVRNYLLHTILEILKHIELKVYICFKYAYVFTRIYFLMYSSIFLAYYLVYYHVSLVLQNKFINY